LDDFGVGLVINEVTWERIQGKNGRRDSLNVVKRASQEMFISTIKCAELFQMMRLLMSPIRTAYGTGFSLPIESRGRGIKDLFRNQSAWPKITGAFLPYNCDVTIGFPHCLG